MIANISKIEQTLTLLFFPEDTIELRSLGGRVGNGFYRSQDKLAQDAFELSNAGQNAYVCLNKVKPELFSRRPEEFDRCKKGEAAGNQDIVCRRWLLVDVDPVRPAGVSATDLQKQAAVDLADSVFSWLKDRLGDRCLVLADSGNGAHILVRLPDVPNDKESEWHCKKILEFLNRQFTTAEVEIDLTTYNASRICTLYGTVKRKGTDTPEQPHRLSTLVRVPDQLEAVDWQLLSSLVEPYSGDQPTQHASENGKTWDIAQILDERRVKYSRDDEYRTGSGEPASRFELCVCPWNGAHTDRSAWIIQWQSGATAAGCHHNGCNGKGWAELKQVWNLPAATGITAADIVLPSLPGNASSHTSLYSPDSYNEHEPPVLDLAAYHGPIGQIVLGIKHQTEAAPVAILCCTLAYFGNLIGRQYFIQLDQEHYPKLYVALVGATGAGRKGTADVQARRIVDAIDPNSSQLRHTGLTTGEGLLLVLDENREGMHPRPAMFTEREFAAVLKRAERKGNTLSMFIRDAWDDETLANSTKHNPMRISDHHIGICAHVTPAELKRLLSNADVANGFCNRFLWVLTRRDGLKPGAKGFRADEHQQLIGQLKAAISQLRQRVIDSGHKPQQVPFSPAAEKLWRDQLYSQLDIDSDEDTLMTLMCSRQAQQVARLGLIFALADGQFAVQPEYLHAACAIASYVWDSVDYILSRQWWGDSGNVHDPAGMAPKLLHALQSQGVMTRTDISVQVFQRHRTAREINALRNMLVDKNRIRVEKRGKVELWHPLN